MSKSFNTREQFFILLDKTASTVASSGSEVEELLKQQALGNNKLSFLDHDNVYRPFYDDKVKQYSARLISC